MKIRSFWPISKHSQISTKMVFWVKFQNIHKLHSKWFFGSNFKTFTNSIIIGGVGVGGCVRGQGKEKKPLLRRKIAISPGKSGGQGFMNFLEYGALAAEGRPPAQHMPLGNTPKFHKKIMNPNHPILRGKWRFFGGKANMNQFQTNSCIFEPN